MTQAKSAAKCWVPSGPTENGRFPVLPCGWLCSLPKPACARTGERVLFVLPFIHFDCPINWRPQRLAGIFPGIAVTCDWHAVAAHYPHELGWLSRTVPSQGNPLICSFLLTDACPILHKTFCRVNRGCQFDSRLARHKKGIRKDVLFVLDYPLIPAPVITRQIHLLAARAACGIPIRVQILERRFVWDKRHSIYLSYLSSPGSAGELSA